MMRLGLLLDNCEPANSSYRKLKAMNAGAVGALWTAGTKHRRNVYEQCELMLGAPLYLVRVGGHRQTPQEWTTDARSALAEVPKMAIAERRALLICGNEPNLEGYADDPEGYGALFWQVCDFGDAPVVFACPSLGKPNWSEYLTRALGGKAPAHFAFNAYSLNASEAGRIRMLLPSVKMYCTEVNSRADQHGQGRVDVIEWALGELGKVGVEAATGFIAGGASGGAWDEGYIFTEEEAAGLGRIQLKETKVGSIAVALLPSNQDRNVSPVQSSYNEHGGMHWLSPLIEAACRALGINARTFQAGAESSDTYKLQHLHEQQDAAMAWLKQQPEQWKAAVNFHTDSGDFSHTYAIYGTTREQRSKLLAEAIGPLVQQALGTTSYAAFDKRGDKDYSTYVFYQASGPNVAAVLIELCSHVHANDINTLFARPQQVAEAIARGIANYAGLTSGVNWEAKAGEYKALADSRGAALDAARVKLAAIAKMAVSA